MRQSTQLGNLRKDFRGRLRESPRALALLDALFVNPYLTTTRASNELGVSLPTAREAIRTLQAVGMVRPTDDRAWRRLYVAQPILDAIEQPFIEYEDE